MWQTMKAKLESHLLSISLISIGVGILFFVAALFMFFQKDYSELPTSKNQDDSFLDGTVQESEAEAISADEKTKEVAAQVLYVDVKGAVQQPGVYQVSPGMRILDAIDLAGGFLVSADQSQINLALKLEDQMIVYIPQVGEEIKEFMQQPTLGGTETEKEGGKININTADSTQLQTLNGIGEKKAELIIQYREENGSFQTIEELKNVSGIGEKTFDALKDSVIAGSE